MATTKVSAKKTTVKSTAVKDGYVFQPFSAKSVALIYKYNLQMEESYKKLITSYERINSLPTEDPRKENLIDLWESEFNRVFKDFWEKSSSASSSSKSKKGVEGWKERLDVKESSTAPDQKRLDLLNRLTPGANTSGRKSKEEILKRAGYQERTSTAAFNFQAEGRTGQKLKELESLLDVAEEKGIGQPESLLSLGKNEQNLPFNSSSFKYDDEGYLDIDSSSKTEAVPDPELANFVNSNLTGEFNPSSSVSNSSVDINFSNQYSNSDSLSRSEFNKVNNITAADDNSEKYFGEFNPMAQAEDAFIPFDLESGTFDEDIARQIYHSKGEKNPLAFQETKLVYTKADELIDPMKRNIVSKEGFEINKEKKVDFALKRNFNVEDAPKPYHEIKPVGNYQVEYDKNKRPSYSDMIIANQKEASVVDELQEKIDFLRDLRSERRHRINMMKIERTNNLLISRAKRLAELREKKRIKRREEMNLRAIDKADKLRRAQERQKIIDLMKERHMKQSDEKRVATILKMERERRLEKQAGYRAEVATMDAQIRHEQELIKRTELKMRAYYAKSNADVKFEDQLSTTNELDKYLTTSEKAEKMLRLEQKKRSERIEKISKKFNKNTK